jgi:hypothetical protein
LLLVKIAWHRQAHPHIELKTLPSFRPVSLSLSMDNVCSFLVVTNLCDEIKRIKAFKENSKNRPETKKFEIHSTETIRK